MATIGNSNLTLLDLAKREDPDGKQARIIEMLSKKAPTVQDMIYKQGNLDTGHKTTVRTSLPEPTWRKINQGVRPSKSTTSQIVETCGLLEALSAVDQELVEIAADKKAFRLSEAMAHMAGMTYTHENTIFYGNNSVDGEQFTGFAPRYNSLGAENGQNIINGNGSGSNNTSIWLVAWGDDNVHGIVPKNTTAGLQHKDLGERVITEADGTKMVALMDQWKWRTGLVVKDWRTVVRIANIDTTALTVDASTGVDLDAVMEESMIKLPSLNDTSGKLCFYMNRKTVYFLNQQRKREVQL